MSVIHQKNFICLILRIIFVTVSIVQLQAQSKIKVFIVDTENKPVPYVTITAPGNKTYQIGNGEALIELESGKINSDISDNLKITKKGWRTLSVEYFRQEQELHVMLDKAGLGKLSDVNSPVKSAQEKYVHVKVILENGSSVANLTLKYRGQSFITSTNGYAFMPLSYLTEIKIDSFLILKRESLKYNKVVMVVSKLSPKGNLEESIENVVNQVRTEQFQYEQSNTLINQEISTILKRVGEEKTLTVKEKGKLRNYVKLLTNEISHNNSYFELNKFTRDSLLEKLNFLLIEKDSINKINQIKIQALENEKLLERKESRNRLILISVIAIVLLCIIFLLVILFGKVRKQKADLEAKNMEVLKKKEELHSVYKELNDNITSAKVIQNAILPGKSVIKKIIPDFSVFYQPKNIVSGDFYWCFERDDKFMIAAVDCTGHGVAGAFMSFIGYEILNQIARENKYASPGEILTQLNIKLIGTLNVYGTSGVSSGMDISLCIYDKDKKTMQYAGANNPLYILRKEDNEIEQISADRQGIGGRQKKENFQFRTNEVFLSDGDSFCMFSDGYADQIGGELSQKFMYSRFRQLFKDIASSPSDKREKLLEKQFNDWKQDNEQLDDVLVMCFTIPQN